MSIQHTVLFEFKADADETKVRDAIASLNRLPELIKEIQAWELVEDEGKREGSFRFALLATFADMAAMEHYLVHPEHQNAVAKAALILSQVAEHDYTVAS